PVAALPRTLSEAGYETVGMGDWSSTDFEKIGFGFDRTVTPPETWSLRTFVGRGGRLGALLVLLHLPAPILDRVAPEVAHYPGVDASAICEAALARELERLSRSPRPFFLVSFTGNT